MNVTPPKTQSKPIMSVDEAVNKDDPRPGGHDKKFQSRRRDEADKSHNEF